MPRHLHLDFETFSQADIKSVGAYRYAYDPSTEILCAAMALDFGPTVAWWGDIPGPFTPEEYWDALEDPSVEIWCHNAMFEMAICQALLWKTWSIKCPDLSRFRCTMSLARRAALPASLEKLGPALGLSTLKDARGKTLLRKFSVMQLPKRPTKKNPQGLPARRIMPTDEPEAFGELIEYCRQDVRVEQQVARKLSYFDDALNNRNYSLDARINARGVTVNVGALQHAQKLIEEETEEVGKKFRELTGINITQTAKVLEWVNVNGAQLNDLQADTIDSYLEQEKQKIGEPGIVEQALRMKQAVSYAAVKKVSTMLACCGPHDNRIRGMLNHHGATTGRWTASLVQMQNMKRPAPGIDTEDAYQDICEGISREGIDLCHGAPLEVISSCIRHFVQDACPHCWSRGDGDIEVEGILSCRYCGGTCYSEILDADYSAIEARIVAWLAGQEDVLEEFRQGVDCYKSLASLIYGIPVEEVNKFPQRFVGKQARLGLGFGMGASKFRQTCKVMGDYDLPLGLEDTAVAIFRAKNKRIVSFWYDTERAAKRAILNPGKAFVVNKLTFMVKDLEGLPFLLMKLPSGRKLAYPKPRISSDRITFFGKKGTTTQWGDVSTWGGTLVENATQAVAADVMAQGAWNAERNGYEIATLIHDQALAYHKPGQTPEDFVRLLTDLPAWADGLPIAAEGALVPFYKKD